MRKSTSTGLLVGLLAVAAMAVSAASAGAVTTSQLTKNDQWTCITAPPLTDDQHCFGPKGFDRFVTEDAKAVKALVFDPSGQEFLGVEINIRDDVFHNQPCPTDPSQTDPVTYTYTDLYPLFGLHYWACHRFDSDHL